MVGYTSSFLVLGQRRAPYPTLSRSPVTDVLKHRRNTFALILLTGVASLFAFFRDAMIAMTFGTSNETDAFFLGTLVPTILYTVLVTGTVASSFLPVYIEAMELAGLESANRILASTSSLLFATLLGIVILGELTAPIYLRLMAPGLDQSTISQASGYLRLSLPLLLFFGPSTLAASVLMSRNRFLIPGFGQVVFNAVIFASVVVAEVSGLWIVCGGMVAASLLQLALHGAALDAPTRRALFPFLAAGDRAGAFRVARLAAPVSLFMILAQAVPILERGLASGLSAGTISHLTYAGKVMQFPGTLITATFITILFPLLSQAASSGDQLEFNRLLHWGMIRLGLVTAVVSSIMASAALPITKILFERGEFTPNDASATAQMLAIYSLGLMPMALGTLATRAFHSRQDTRTPLYFGVLNTSFYLLLGFALVDTWGGNGIALAFAGSAYTGAGLATAIVARRLTNFPLQAVLRDIWWISAGVVCAGVPTWIVLQYEVVPFYRDTMLAQLQSLILATILCLCLFLLFQIVTGHARLIRMVGEWIRVG